MDALTYIIAFMVAIIAAWVGYFLGNFFPVFGKAKRIKQANKAAGRPMTNFSPLRQFTTRVMDWLLEREEESFEEPFEQNIEGAEIDNLSEEIKPQSSEEILKAAEVTEDPVLLESVLSQTPGELDDDALVVWHDRRKRKILAKIKKDIVDLDTDLTPSQHGVMSMMLVDLQERVGLSATLREAISQETDLVFAEKERKRMIPKKEEEVKPPSFNPLRTFVNYVQADAPKIEEKPESIPDQINVILQKLIKDTPLADRGISMAEWPNRGAVFIVGVEIYDEIHKIPDPEIRTAIRAAVKEWEATQEEF